jgi:hypothetical protein
MLKQSRKKDLASYARYLLLKMRGYSKAKEKKHKQSIALETHIKKG